MYLSCSSICSVVLGWMFGHALPDMKTKTGKSKPNLHPLPVLSANVQSTHFTRSLMFPTAIAYAFQINTRCPRTSCCPALTESRYWCNAPSRFPHKPSCPQNKSGVRHVVCASLSCCSKLFPRSRITVGRSMSLPYYFSFP